MPTRKKKKTTKKLAVNKPKTNQQPPASSSILVKNPPTNIVLPPQMMPAEKSSSNAGLPPNKNISIQHPAPPKVKVLSSDTSNNKATPSNNGIAKLQPQASLLPQQRRTFHPRPPRGMIMPPHFFPRPPPAGFFRKHAIPNEMNVEKAATIPQLENNKTKPQTQFPVGRRLLQLPPRLIPQQQVIHHLKQQLQSKDNEIVNLRNELKQEQSDKDKLITSLCNIVEEKEADKEMQIANMKAILLKAKAKENSRKRVLEFLEKESPKQEEVPARKNGVLQNNASMPHQNNVSMARIVPPPNNAPMDRNIVPPNNPFRRFVPTMMPPIVQLYAKRQREVEKELKNANMRHINAQLEVAELRGKIRQQNVSIDYLMHKPKKQKRVYIKKSKSSLEGTERNTQLKKRVKKTGKNVSDTNNDSPLAVQQWMDDFNNLKAYKEEFGSCVIRGNGTAEDDKVTHLRSFIQEQLLHLRQLQEGITNTLTPGKIELLDSIGFVWPSLNDDCSTWKGRFQQLCDFEKEHHHFNIPQSYGKGLGHWVLWQRRNYRKGVLEPEQTKQLEKIGFMKSNICGGEATLATSQQTDKEKKLEDDSFQGIQNTHEEECKQGPVGAILWELEI